MLTLDGPISLKAPYLWHGGDYNPEQWPREVWADDFRLMQKAGVTVATVGVFSWVALQPAEEKFTFDWLDEILDGLDAHGIKAILATPSAAQPAWMSQAYPQMLRSDDRGIRRQHGGRTNYCPNSSDYRRLSGAMAYALAERYKDHPSLILWHISNEYAGQCLCETCAACFREWLQHKYKTLDELNARWWTAFWSHSYTDWSQIMPPLSNGETHTHGLNLDYFRFMNDSQLECFCNERDIIRFISPDIPITTNLMGAYKPLDYRRWAREMDVISWDCYPQPNQSAGEIAFAHDLNRGLKDGQPFLLMEQTPSSQNWQSVNALKRPGVLRLWSYLAVAHGADSVLYFQWRRGRGGGEKLHGAVIEHSGRADTRVFREVSQIGSELQQLGDAIVGARTQARVAVLFDWENWHALDNAIGPVQDKRYHDTVRKHYLAFHDKNIPVDIVFTDSDFSSYAILIAPMLYMLKAGFADKVKVFVRSGGTFVTTYFTGIVDETDLAFDSGYPGPLSRLLGLWVEEIDAMYDGQSNTMVMSDDSGVYSCNRLADLLHTTTAEVLATYGSDFYKGMPCVTKNEVGKGCAYYIATDPDSQFLDKFYGDLLQKQGITPLLDAPKGVEIAVRHKNGNAIVFVLNHSAGGVSVDLGSRVFHDLLSGEQVSNCITLDGYGVRILIERAMAHKFPGGFLWGASTAALQIEGATREDGRGESIWDRFAQTPGKIADGDTPEIACDHYHRYREDVALMAELGISAYRFSIAWSRILPDGKGSVNAPGLAFYDRLIDELLQVAIQPMVTLYHWDLPQALEDEGGWLNHATCEHFLNYVDIVSRAFGDRVHTWATFNEPQCIAYGGYVWGAHAPGYCDATYAQANQALHHILLSHGKAIPVLRANSPDCKVGISLNLGPVHPATDSEPDQAAALRVWDRDDRWFLDPIFKGTYPAERVALLGNAAPRIEDGDMQIISTPIDFLGVNYYARTVVGDAPEITDIKAQVMQVPGAELTEMGWEVYPDALDELLMRIHQEYAPKELFITENGRACADTIGVDGQVHDSQRISYLQSHFAAMHHAIQQGVPLKGYFVWSLLDNFEWAFGYSKRFGLVYVDYATQRRLPKASFAFYQQVIRENAVIFG